MNNVWGRGGLFEQALSSKLANQDAETALTGSKVGVDMMNAQTSRTGVDNDYDIGLRRNAVERGMLDVNRMNADTERFGAETGRMQAASPLGLTGPVTQQSISNLGLRSFSAPAATQSASRPTIFQNGNSFSDREPLQMKRGGLVLKPKMVKQPGYMHGGKITPPKGYKRGGKIGDVKKDTGRDTVDVKAREGEYMLNPETVAHLGGGSYEAGVRNLNQIVREATGKEPGPVPVGKSGKAGYARSGTVLPENAFIADSKGNVGRLGDMEGFRAAQQRMSDARMPVVVEQPRAPSSALVEVRNPNMGPQGAGQWARPTPQAPSTPAPELTRAQRFEKAGSNAGRVVREMLGASKGAVPESLRGLPRGTVLPLAATGATMAYNVADNEGFYNDPEVPVLEKGKQWLRDVAEPVAGYVGGAIGAGAGSVASPVAGTIAGGLAGYAGGAGLANVLIDDEGEALRKWKEANQPAAPAATAAPAQGAAAEKTPPAAPRDFDKEVADKLAESKAAGEAAKLSLRDMYLKRLSDIDKANQTSDGIFGASDRIREKDTLLNNLTELEKSNATAAANMVTARAAAADKAEKAADERLAARYRVPKYDDKGNIVGDAADPNARVAIQNFMATMPRKKGEPIPDFYQLSPAQQDFYLEKFDRYKAAQDRFNARVREEGGSSGIISNAPRIGPNSLRIVAGPDGTPAEIELGDIGDANISLGDWWKSTFDNGVNNMLVYDPVTDQRVAAPRVLRNANGTVDGDMFKAMSQGLRARQ